ncbi:MAG: (2Fe-2S)-binding protein [Erysipelotrichia bacterium]|jgi:bacterioferritin-associated ferredoxin|nr:(2Fe-2S)-binding protein [Erysipelotrichia bacterium]
MDKSKIIICRCEDVTLADVHRVLEEGYTTFEDLKRLLRVGMGPCQANTCGFLIQKEIAKFHNIPLEDVLVHKVRPLSMGVTLDQLVKGDNHED